MSTKFGTNVSNRMLLNAAKFRGYSLYRFWVIKGKPTGGKMSIFRVSTYKIYVPCMQKTVAFSQDAVGVGREPESNTLKFILKGFVKKFTILTILLKLSILLYSISLFENRRKFV